MQTNTQVAGDALARLANVIETRLPAQGGDPDSSYVARLLHKGPDAFLKKIGEEATEWSWLPRMFLQGPTRPSWFTK